MGLLRHRQIEATFNQRLKQKVLSAAEVDEWLKGVDIEGQPGGRVGHS